MSGARNAMVREASMSPSHADEHREPGSLDSYGEMTFACSVTAQGRPLNNPIHGNITTGRLAFFRVIAWQTFGDSKN